MSGVEAIVGVVSAGAGLVALSIQLGESAMKLKRLSQAAKDAPGTIERLLFDLETMSLALGQLEQHRRHDTHSEALMTRCITQCQQYVQDIQQLADNLDRCLTRHARVRGRLYTAFKERDVKELLGDLERAKSSLNLAYMMYMGVEQQKLHQEHRNMLCSLQDLVTVGSANISQQLTLLLPSSEHAPRHPQNVPRSHLDEGNEMSLTATYGPNTLSMTTARNHSQLCNSAGLTIRAKRKNERPRFRARLNFPTWLSSRVWDVALVGAQSGWNIQFRTYNWVPVDAPVFEYAKRGDLQRMRRLIDSGEASPLDMSKPYDEAQHCETLLEVAADYGWLEICRYLLSLITFPDQGTILSKSLNRFGFYSGPSVDVYRLFMAAPGFDVDIYDPFIGEHWLRYCPNLHCLNVIMEYQGLELSCRSLAARFELAVNLRSVTFSDFLGCIELQQSDRELAHLRDSSGKSALHYVARRLAVHSHEPAFKEWFDFGVGLLRNGADPCNIAADVRGQDGWQSTPLLTYLRARHGLRRLCDVSVETECIDFWINMLQVAGIDLLQYGAKESKIWESFRCGNSLDIDMIGLWSPLERLDLQVKRLLYGPTPADWGVEFFRIRIVRVHKLQKLPGAYSSGCDNPDRIIWKPYEVEENEGVWKVIARKTLVSALVDSRRMSSRTREPFLGILDDSQDDSGVIALMQRRATLKREKGLRYRQRSRSQPPILQRREVAYCAQQEPHSRKWLGPCHLCPFDSRWKFGCHRVVEEVLCDNRAGDVFDVRSCVLGLSLYEASAQESWDWQEYSFLADVARCQDERVYSLAMTKGGHTGTADCAWGCAKVSLNQLHVPESLRPGHPQRLFKQSLLT